MPGFIRIIAGIVIVVILTFMVGCAQTGKATNKQSPFPWAKAKEPEKASTGSMNDFMKQPRPAVASTRLGTSR